MSKKAVKKVEVEDEDEPVQDGQKVRKKKAEPLDHDDFTTRVGEVEKAWHGFAHYYVKFNSGGVQTDVDSPTKAEMGSINKLLGHLDKLYGALCKPWRKQKPAAEGERRGFNVPRFARKEAVVFFNSEGCELTPDLKLQQLFAAGGDAILPHASAIQLVNGYIEKHQLKRTTGDEKAAIAMDKAMTELFRPHIGRIEKRKWIETPEKLIVVEQTMMQKLIPLLFDQQVAVPAALLTKEETDRIDKRSAFLSKRTLVNAAKRAEVESEAKRKISEAKKKAKEEEKKAKLGV
jgi:hypothetical protein